MGKDYITPKDLYDKLYRANLGNMPADTDGYSFLLLRHYSSAWDNVYRGSGSFTELNNDLKALCDAINNIL